MAQSTNVSHEKQECIDDRTEEEKALDARLTHLEENSAIQKSMRNGTLKSELDAMEKAHGKEIKIPEAPKVEDGKEVMYINAGFFIKVPKGSNRDKVRSRVIEMLQKINIETSMLEVYGA